MLEAERSSIRERLSALESVLGAVAAVAGQGAGSAVSAPSAPRRRGRPPGSRNAPKVGAARAGKFGLREAVGQALAKQPLSINELVPAVQRLGYRFASKNPRNSLGAYLYSPRGQEDFRKTPEGFVVR